MSVRDVEVRSEAETRRRLEEIESFHETRVSAIRNAHERELKERDARCEMEMKVS